MGYNCVFYGILIILSGCQLADKKTTPRTFDCHAICEGCERCEVICESTGQGVQDDSINLKGPQ